MFCHYPLVNNLYSSADRLRVARGPTGFSHLLYELCLVSHQSLSVHVPSSDGKEMTERMFDLLAFFLMEAELQSIPEACPGLHRDFTFGLGIRTLSSAHTQGFALH